MAQIIFVSLGIVILAALVIRRLLGVSRGHWTVTLTAVVAGEAAALGTLQVVAGDVTALSWDWVPAGLALVAGYSMLAFALIQMLVRLGSRRRLTAFLHPIAGTRRLYGRYARYLQVIRIVIRKGLLRSAGDGPGTRGSRLGRSLAATFDEAGGLFVKLGQAMAAQPQLVTASVASELARLQDQAAPADPAAVLAVVEEEIGSPAEIFADFSEVPAGAASIAQTHFARLKDGREVVVKVQRPGIREAVERDLDILDRLADRLDRQAAWARSLGLKELAAGFAEATREELDFRLEAASIVAARRALRESDPVTIPELMDEFTTDRVLVEERVDGRSIGAPGVLGQLDAGRRRVLADALLGLLVRQMVGGEQFHADPHPGNVFLRSDGRLALIDFGAVGRLNRFERAGLIDILRGLQAEDPALLRQAALRIGQTTGRVDAEALDRELARLLARTVDVSGRLDPAVFGETISVFRDFGILLPRSTTTLFRALMTLTGTLELIAPGYDLTEGLKRGGGGALAQQVLPKNLGEFAQLAMNEAAVLNRIPRDIDDVARSLLRGELRTRVSLLSEPEDVAVVRGMLNRVLTAAIGAALALTSAILLTVQPRAGQGVSLVEVVGSVGLTFAVLLLLRVVVQVVREPNS